MLHILLSRLRIKAFIPSVTVIDSKVLSIMQFIQATMHESLCDSGTARIVKDLRLEDKDLWSVDKD